MWRLYGGLVAYAAAILNVFINNPDWMAASLCCGVVLHLSYISWKPIEPDLICVHEVDFQYPGKGVIEIWIRKNLISETVGIRGATGDVINKPLTMIKFVDLTRVITVTESKEVVDALRARRH